MEQREELISYITNALVRYYCAKEKGTRLDLAALVADFILDKYEIKEKENEIDR